MLKVPQHSKYEEEESSNKKVTNFEEDDDDTPWISSSKVVRII